MTMHDTIEARLLRAVEVTPSADGLRRLDQRVARAMTQPTTIPYQGLRTRRLFLRPLLIVAAFLLLTGAVAGGLGLLDQIFQSSGMPGWRTAWDRAERLDLKQTDAGVTITLERAYADLNQVLVGFTVEGLEAAPVTGHGEAYPLEWRAQLRDPSGRTEEQWTNGLGGTYRDQPGLSAVVWTWEGAVAPVAGTWELTFTSIGYNAGGLVSGECTVGNTDPACANPPPNAMVDGTWRFAFELPKPAGTLLSPVVTSTQGGATLTLTELRISPTMITSRIALRVADNTVADWSLYSWGPSIGDRGFVRHGGTEYLTNSSSHVTQDPLAQGPDGDVNEFYTIAGADVATGTWEIEISEITYRSSIYNPAEEQIHLSGPWTLTVNVP